ncbi:cyclin-J18-like isoform X1 [Coffea arabica]|uniref:Cyclin-J18-like isoform X1 n=1 Tax=Coffea arabica TaxID=13443 RepID=A0A6P6UX46_COFAR|nr:cyclin-J18-like isoform X3 [Coffea arabica]
MKNSSRELCSCTRPRVLEFLIHCAQELDVSPMVKYSALTLFAERFYPSLSRFQDDRIKENWLLHPMTESNLQLFALTSLWISSKMHDSPPLSVKCLKSLGDKFIKDQHFTARDLLEAVLEFKIGTLNIAFTHLEELLIQLKGVAQIGEYVKLGDCLDIMDILYEKEETMVVAYVIMVPKQRWEFPILPWVKFVTLCEEEDILNSVRNILRQILEPQAM